MASVDPEIAVRAIFAAIDVVTKLGQLVQDHRAAKVSDEAAHTALDRVELAAESLTWKPVTPPE